MNKFFLGVDVSKGYADFVILDSNKRVVEENFQLDDTFDGHCRLYEQLRIFFEQHPESTLFAAVESTGGYENNWYNSMIKFQESLNIKTAHLNPLGISYNSKADLKRNITDKISAQNVAEYMIAHPEKVSYQHQDPLASLRKQWRFIKMLTKQSTQLLNQLESLVYTANPELLVYCKDGVPQWILRLLVQYPTATRLSKAKIKSVAKIPYISMQRANELIITAKKSVASCSDPVTEQLIAATVKQIMHLKQLIKHQTKLLENFSPSLPELELLKTFPGINDYSAVGLMLDIQTVHRFASSKKLASFFGLHPEYKKSGDGSWGFHMSKKGRKEPRRILFMVTLTAIRTNPVIEEIYLKHVEKGMEKMAAIGLCMHKTLRIIFGMLKHNKAFDPQIDRKNRDRMLSCKKENKMDRARRYQTFDPKAPVSRRQNINRKERGASHSDDITKSGIVAPVPIATLAN